MTNAGLSTAIARLWRLAAGTELRRNILETYGTRVVIIAATFATAVVIARVLGPTGRGFYAVATTIGAIGVQFSNFGLHASNTYYVAKDRALLPALIGNTLVAILAACVVTALSGIALAARFGFGPDKPWLYAHPRTTPRR
jgi:O-antigen/teichoic acid export membrane protein